MAHSANRGSRSRQRVRAVGWLATGSLVLVVGTAGTVTAGTSARGDSGPPCGAAFVLSHLSEAQRVGQLFMVGGPATGVGPATTAAIHDYHVGNVFLSGRSYAGTAAVAQVSAGLRAQVTTASTGGVALYVATDQEGGSVQVLQGPGFSALPTALTQGTYATTTLRSLATTWGAQLRSAGVNLDLAPVMDTVPSAAAAAANPPIGFFHREFGYSTSTVASHGTAFAQGLLAGGVDATLKHFPGLGRVSANTDTTAGVTDHVTTRNDPYLSPFAAGIAAGAPVVMISTAYYAKIDPTRPAVFSPTVINGILRGDLAFHGVVISDDLGNAVQVQAWSPATRAVDFIAAGGDMVLTVNPDLVPQMVAGVIARAAVSATFRAQVDAAALRVLVAKQHRGLLHPPACPGDYNGDGRADIAVWQPSNGTWYVRGISTVRFGIATDVPVPGDYNGDGRADIAVWRPATGTWYIRGMTTTRWGLPTDVPVPADYDGDGRTDVAVWRPSNGTWYIRGISTTLWGRSIDVPVPGDYNGDGRADIAVWQPSNGTWYVRGISTTLWGRSIDVPVPGDYNGDGRTDIAVRQPSNGTWYVRGISTTLWGIATDVAVQGDYNGDGRTDVAVWKPATGTWYVRGISTTRWGLPSDVPV